MKKYVYTSRSFPRNNIYKYVHQYFVMDCLYVLICNFIEKCNTVLFIESRNISLANGKLIIKCF